jgi:hypothetical protein
VIERLINEVRWPFFVELFLSLAALWVIKKFLHISLARTLKTITTEFTKVLQLKFGRGAINALTILALLLLLVLYLFLNPFRELLHLVADRQETHAGSDVLFLIAFYVIALVGMFSVSATDA